MNLAIRNNLKTKNLLCYLYYSNYQLRIEEALNIIK